MWPIPASTTEVLDEDIKELKMEFHELRGDIRRIEVGLAKIAAEFGVARWFLGLVLLATISAIGTQIWWAATLTNEVSHLGQEVKKLTEAVSAPTKAQPATGQPAPVKLAR